MQDRGPAAYIAEFIGTLLLVFFITAVVSLYVAVPSQANPTPFIDFSVIGLVHAFLLFALIQTLARDLRRALQPGGHGRDDRAAPDQAARMRPSTSSPSSPAAWRGALLTKLLLEDEGKARGLRRHGRLRALDEAILPGMVVEAIGTFFLVWVIVGVAVNPRATKEWAALAIGATLGMLVMVLAPLTGAGFNPARSFGPAIVSGEFNGGAATSCSSTSWRP